MAAEMKWEALSCQTLGVMRDLGNFSPTFHAINREVKGYKLDSEGEAGKCYYTSSDLRQIAIACKEVADWLDKRAQYAKETP